MSTMGHQQEPYRPEKGPGQKEKSEEEITEISDRDRMLQYAAIDPKVPRRIHIIGLGSIGKLVAHSLAGISNPPPITLIAHIAQWLDAWDKSKKVIKVQDGDQLVVRGGFDAELRPELTRRHGVQLDDTQPDVYRHEMQPHEAAHVLDQQNQERQAQGDTTLYTPTFGGTRWRNDQDTPSKVEKHRRFSDEPIHNLIITTKSPVVVAALLSIRHRISRTSTICFLQNGIGVVDQVNQLVFPDESTRPNYIQGIVTHGANVPPDIAARDPFYVVHAGHGTISLSILPRFGLNHSSTNSSTETKGSNNDGQPEDLDASARYLLRTLTRTPVLGAVEVSPTELFQQQLEKLAVNSVLNPLTALIDARNGELAQRFELKRSMRLLLAETSLVFRSLPELAWTLNVNLRFSPERLEHLCLKVAKQTAENISSMLADVRAGRQTEVNYINGYVVNRGEELGIKCVVNYAIMQVVLGKAQITRGEAAETVPVERNVD